MKLIKLRSIHHNKMHFWSAEWQPEGFKGLRLCKAYCLEIDRPAWRFELSRGVDDRAPSKASRLMWRKLRDQFFDQRSDALQALQALVELEES